MKTASSPGRINAISTVKITIETRNPTDKPMIATHLALLHNPPGPGLIPVLMGRETLATSWPDNVVKLAVELRAAIEDHLLQVYFSDERNQSNDRRGDFPIDVPTGLGGSGLVGPEDEPTPL